MATPPPLIILLILIGPNMERLLVHIIITTIGCESIIKLFSLGTTIPSGTGGSPGSIATGIILVVADHLEGVVVAGHPVALAALTVPPGAEGDEEDEDEGEGAVDPSLGCFGDAEGREDVGEEVLGGWGGSWGGGG